MQGRDRAGRLLGYFTLNVMRIRSCTGEIPLVSHYQEFLGDLQIQNIGVCGLTLVNRLLLLSFVAHFRSLFMAAYKGYYTRKFMKRLAEEAAHIFDVDDVDSTTAHSEHLGLVHDLEEASSYECTDIDYDYIYEEDPFIEIQDLLNEILDIVVEQAEEINE